MIEKIKKLIEPEISKMGYQIEEITYEKEQNTNFLTIVIDKEPFITIDDCVKVTKVVGPLLDEANYIEDNYMLDVCSKEKGE